jgi:hypothetical protein
VQAGLTSGSFLLLLIQDVLLEVKEELTREVTIGDGLVVMKGKRLATCEYKILGDLNTKSSCSG